MQTNHKHIFKYFLQVFWLKCGSRHHFWKRNNRNVLSYFRISATDLPNWFEQSNKERIYCTIDCFIDIVEHFPFHKKYNSRRKYSVRIFVYVINFLPGFRLRYQPPWNGVENKKKLSYIIAYRIKAKIIKSKSYKWKHVKLHFVWLTKNAYMEFVTAD